MKRFAIALAVLCCWPAIAKAVDIGFENPHYYWNVISQPTLPIVVRISGGESIDSAALGFSVGDGGAAMGGVETIPVNAIDYTTATIWAGKALTTDENPALPSASSTVANVAIDGTYNVSANGNLMTVTLGQPAGGLSDRIGETLTLSPNAADTTAVYVDGSPVNVTWASGSLTLTPEPSGLVMLAAVAVLGLFWYHRRK